MLGVVAAAALTGTAPAATASPADLSTATFSLASSITPTVLAATPGPEKTEARAAETAASTSIQAVATVQSDIAASGLDIGQPATVDTTALQQATDRLEAASVLPETFLPALSHDVAAATAAVDQRVAELRGGLDAAVAKKAEEEAAEKARQEAEAAAAAKAAADKAAAEKQARRRRPRPTPAVEGLRPPFRPEAVRETTAPPAPRPPRATCSPAAAGATTRCRASCRCGTRSRAGTTRPTTPAAAPTASAGPPRQQDVVRRCRLADQRRHSGVVGPRVHLGPLRHAVRRVGPLAVDRLVLSPQLHRIIERAAPENPPVRRASASSGRFSGPLSSCRTAGPTCTCHAPWKRRRPPDDDRSRKARRGTAGIGSVPRARGRRAPTTALRRGRPPARNAVSGSAAQLLQRDPEGLLIGEARVRHRDLGAGGVGIPPLSLPHRNGERGPDAPTLGQRRPHHTRHVPQRRRGIPSLPTRATPRREQGHGHDGTDQGADSPHRDSRDRGQEERQRDQRRRRSRRYSEPPAEGTLGRHRRREDRRAGRALDHRGELLAVVVRGADAPGGSRLVPRRSRGQRVDTLQRRAGGLLEHLVERATTVAPQRRGQPADDALGWSASSPHRPACLRRRRAASGCASRGESGGSSAETVQLWATFSGQLGSRRSVRPRNCCVADAVATAVRSIRVFTAGQSHPSPKRPRVPTTTSSEPSASSRETAPTTPDPVVPRTSRTATSSGQGSPSPGRRARA